MEQRQAGDVPSSPLPYQDSKPVGAADFYFAINATFRFIHRRFGMEGLRRYWRELGTHYRAPVAARWRQQGLPGVAAYWRAFFAAEPGADVEVTETAECVSLEVRTCPALRHLRSGGREILPGFCQHCYYAGEATAASAGFTLRLEGGNGSCRQTFYPSDANIPPQELTAIVEVQ